MSSRDLPRVRLEVRLAGAADLKSLESLVWEGMPGFVVLTGPNGSGKTQLLTLMAYKLAGVHQSPLGPLGHVDLTIEGDSFGPETVVFIPSQWSLGGSGTASIDQMVNVRQQFWGELQPNNTQHEPNRRARSVRFAKRLGVNHINELSVDEFMKRLPDDFSYLLDEGNITSGMAHVFFGYRLRVFREMEAGLSKEQAKQKLGPAPWDLLNEAFETAEFPFRVASPEGTDPLAPLNFRLRVIGSDLMLWPSELSSGEQVILGVIAWLYQSNNFGGFPKLLLLDEADAHLHPSMTRQLIDVLHDVLMKRHGVRIILTTHSPSTVALAPEGSIFEMRRRDASATTPRIAAAQSRADAVARLTSGLVVVSPGARQVLVEDEEDVVFYEMIRDLLTDYGPGKDQRAIKATPPLTFLAASRGNGKEKVGGGCTVVRQWVDKLDQPPFLELVRGIIDRDLANAATARIKVIGRYSIENYCLDPLVVFVALIDLGRAPSIEGMSTIPGTEHRVRESGAPVLQRLVDVVCSTIAEKLGSLSPADSARRMVRFTNGIELSYPAWVLDRRGHDLLAVAQAAFGGPSGLTPPRLRTAFQRLRMIPDELATLMAELQT